MTDTNTTETKEMIALTTATPGQMVVSVRPEMDNGPILYTVRFHISDLAGPTLPLPQSYGLLVFEGSIEYSPGPDPNVRLSGKWRQLTHWEICRLNEAKMTRP
jgi:hypothetical protein